MTLKLMPSPPWIPPAAIPQVQIPRVPRRLVGNTANQQPRLKQQHQQVPVANQRQQQQIQMEQVSQPMGLEEILNQGIFMNFEIV